MPLHTGQNKVDSLQNKLDMLQESVVQLDDKIDTFQNTTEVSTGKHHHEVVELLENISYIFNVFYSCPIIMCI